MQSEKVRRIMRIVLQHRETGKKYEPVMIMKDNVVVREMEKPTANLIMVQAIDVVPKELLRGTVDRSA
jgi:hypothetical protein